MDQTEAELESFRKKWREEVSARALPKPAHLQSTAESSIPKPHTRRESNAPPVTATTLADKPKIVEKYRDDYEDYQPRSYHDIEERETGHKLGDIGSSTAKVRSEPKTALEHYEEAVKKETIGNLRDSINLYRKAFRLDAQVHEAYKNKHFPPSAFKHSSAPPAAAAPSDLPSNTTGTTNAALAGLNKNLSALIADFSQLSIQGEPPPTDLSPAPPCPIASLPEELLADILVHLAIDDVAALGRLAQVCKRFAYLVLTEERIWKRVSLGPEFGFAAMHYAWACQVDWKSTGDDGAGGRRVGTSHKRVTSATSQEQESPQDPKIAFYRRYADTPPQLTSSLVPSTYPTYLAMFRSRPRIRFGGVYISTVNYTRPGASSANQVTWNSPVLIVTYYRYLRFFRDGSVISLLTTHEPADVIAHMSPENVKAGHGPGLPQYAMKDALKGKWRLSGPADTAHPAYQAKLAKLAKRRKATSEEDDVDFEPVSEPMEAEEAIEDEDEDEGTIHIDTEGVIPKYMYRMALTIGSAGRGARSNKLSWQGYWNYNKLTDDWGEFGLKNYRAFYWSRVRRFAGS